MILRIFMMPNASWSGELLLYVNICQADIESSYLAVKLNGSGTDFRQPIQRDRFQYSLQGWIIVRPLKELFADPISQNLRVSLLARRTHHPSPCHTNRANRVLLRTWPIVLGLVACSNAYALSVLANSLALSTPLRSFSVNSADFVSSGSTIRQKLTVNF